MNVIEPLAVTDAILTASNVTEDDHAAWSGATSYVAGNRVILVSTHRIYEAVTGSTGVNPATDDGTYWLDVGATNRWRAFDGRISDPVTKAGSITYSFTMSSVITAMAFFGLSAASAQVVVTDPVDGVVFNETQSLVDGEPVVDWWTYFYEAISYRPSALFDVVPGNIGNVIAVTVTSAGTTLVGQIVLGVNRSLGESVAGTQVGILDFTTVSRDDFGSATIVERPYADEVGFQFAVLTADVSRVRNLLSRLRARPAVYYAGGGTTPFGTTVFGVRGAFRVPLNAGDVSFASLEVEGLT
jgi:hypothetical protein